VLGSTKFGYVDEMMAIYFADNEILVNSSQGIAKMYQHLNV